MKHADVFNTLALRLSNKALFPFYATTLLYFVSYKPWKEIPPETFTAAVCKALPVVTLAVYVRLTSSRKLRYLIPDSKYHQNIILALLFSSLGDIFFIYDSELLEDGMLCFAIAQLFYFSVIRESMDQGPLKYLFLFAGFVSFSFFMNLIDDTIMDVFVLLYLILLYTIGRRATSCLLHGEVSLQSVATCAGSLLFIVSDTLLAANKWSLRLPAVDFIGTLLYYIAQLSYALTCGPVKLILEVDTFKKYFGKSKRNGSNSKDSD